MLLKPQINTETTKRQQQRLACDQARRGEHLASETTVAGTCCLVRTHGTCCLVRTDGTCYLVRTHEGDSPAAIEYPRRRITGPCVSAVYLQLSSYVALSSWLHVKVLAHVFAEGRLTLRDFRITITMKIDKVITTTGVSHTCQQNNGCVCICTCQRISTLIHAVA